MSWAGPMPELVAGLRSGPVALVATGLGAGSSRLGDAHEMFVHYEDVRRVRPGWDPAPLVERRTRTTFLAECSSWFAGRAFGRAPVGVVLRRPDGPSRTVGDRTPVVRSAHRPAGRALLLAFGSRRTTPASTSRANPEAVAALPAPLRCVDRRVARVAAPPRDEESLDRLGGRPRRLPRIRGDQ